MKILIFMCILLLPLAHGLSLDADISVSDNDIVSQRLTVSFDSNFSHDSITYLSSQEPLGVIYDDYSIEEVNGSYAITLMKDVLPGKNTVTFTILYDNLVLRQGSDYVLRTGFPDIQTETSTIKVTLPAGFILTEHAPQATPSPDSITTDGRHIILDWAFHDTDSTAIAVFYYKERSPSGIYLLLLIPLLAILLFLYFRKRSKKAMSDILSEDENKILEHIRTGTTKQKDIAQKLDYSKSKMSKVTRKLEEKDLISREPHFKTNILKEKKKF